MYGRGLDMSCKESSIVSSFCIQFISESDNKKNPALLFYQPGLAGLLCVLHKSSMLIFWQLISTAFYFEEPNHPTVQVFVGSASFLMSSLAIFYSDIRSLTLQLRSLHHISQQTFVHK